MNTLMHRLAVLLCLGVTLPVLADAPALPRLAPRSQPTSLPIAAQPASQGPAAAGSIQAAPLAVCATGFSKTGETKHQATGALYNFTCTTPVITCPKNPALPLSSLEVVILNDNPEASQKRIRYVCKYWSPVP